LVGVQAGWAERATSDDGRVLAVRYLPDVGPFGAVADRHDPKAWSALACLVGPGGRVVLWVMPGEGQPEPWPPVGWEVVMDMPGIQMVADGLEPVDDPDAFGLTAADVPAMLDLVATTKPGPFGPRTIELGGYQGLRCDGRLVAMAGRRMRPGRYTEISAVCTDSDYQGQGLGARLVRSVAAAIMAAGDVPFLHAAGSNVGAIRLYEKLGFTESAAVRFVVLSRGRSPS
jgi:ribosomal protein S18 acetylase RimI-like enzyme